MADALCQSDLLQHGSRLRMRFGGFHAAYQQRHGDVFQRGEFRQQVVELVDETERTVAQFAALRLVHLRYILSQDADAAAGDGVEPAQQMQQGALAGTGCADDGDALAALPLRGSRRSARGRSDRLAHRSCASRGRK